MDPLPSDLPTQPSTTPDPAQTPTGATPTSTQHDTTPAPAPMSLDLPSGTVILNRYRIVSRLGEGGMGAVFRAMDLVLGQDVALKFLSDHHSQDPTCVNNLRQEVLLARRVSHPHVCRVHGIAEYEGRPFLSMEFIDGEDLTSVLRRIGRFPPDKALELARQLCSALQAAHEQGVLHRDLKPANIMLDQQGEVRIADFGIAGAVGSTNQEGLSGTPAYMAPELFSGAPANRRTDVYSLGLVLYEIFTGKRVYRAKSLTELMAQHRKPPSPPTRLVPDLEPTIERVVLRCLEREPERRPESALAILAELPGGNLLAEALRSGQTPSPELVAAAGGVGTMPKKIILVFVGMVLAGLAFLSFFDDQVKLFGQIQLPKSPEILADQAGKHLQSLGHGIDNPRRTYGFGLDDGYLLDIRQNDPRMETWKERLSYDRIGPVSFWFRQVPRQQHFLPRNIKGRVSWQDPAIDVPGMTQVQLDVQGRLRSLIAQPSATPTANQGNGDGDIWSRALAAAGLDNARLEPVEPERIPEVFASERRAWQGTWPEAPHFPVRVEAAAHDGRLVAFRVSEQLWGETWQANAPIPRQRPPTWRFYSLLVLVVIAAGLAVRSLRSRRIDRRGALHVAVMFFCLVFAFTVLGGNHGFDPSAIGNLVVKGLTHALVIASLLTLYYVALEPHVRRIWPETLITWNRLVARRGRDPMVGRSVLIGVTMGVGVTLLVYVRELLVPMITGVWEGPLLIGLQHTPFALMGTGSGLAVALELTVDMAREVLKVLITLVVFAMLLRKRWLALAAATVLWSVVFTPTALAQAPTVTWMANFVTNLATFALLAYGLTRFGFLAGVCGYLVFGLASAFPLQTDLSHWSAHATFLAMALIIAATLFGGSTACRDCRGLG